MVLSISVLIASKLATNLTIAFSSSLIATVESAPSGFVEAIAELIASIIFVIGGFAIMIASLRLFIAVSIAFSPSLIFELSFSWVAIWSFSIATPSSFVISFFLSASIKEIMFSFSFSASSSRSLIVSSILSFIASSFWSGDNLSSLMMSLRSSSSLSISSLRSSFLSSVISASSISSSILSIVSSRISSSTLPVSVSSLISSSNSFSMSSANSFKLVAFFAASMISSADSWNFLSVNVARSLAPAITLPFTSSRLEQKLLSDFSSALDATERSVPTGFVEAIAALIAETIALIFVAEFAVDFKPFIAVLTAVSASAIFETLPVSEAFWSLSSASPSSFVISFCFNASIIEIAFVFSCSTLISRFSNVWLTLFLIAVSLSSIVRLALPKIFLSAWPTLSISSFSSAFVSLVTLEFAICSWIFCIISSILSRVILESSLISVLKRSSNASIIPSIITANGVTCISDSTIFSFVCSNTPSIFAALTSGSILIVPITTLRASSSVTKPFITFSKPPTYVLGAPFLSSRTAFAFASAPLIAFFNSSTSNDFFCLAASRAAIIISLAAPLLPFSASFSAKAKSK